MIDTPDDTSSLTLASYNILHPFSAVKNREPDGVVRLPGGFVTSNWLLRAGKVVRNIKALNCDLVCLQEASPATLRPLRKAFNLITYQDMSAAHEAGPANKRFGTALLAPTSSMKVLGCPPFHNARRAAACVFEHSPSRRQLLVLSVHLKGYPPYQRDMHKLTASKEEGYQELQAYLQQAEAYKTKLDAIIIAGDFNEDAAHYALPLSRHKLMESFGYQRDSNRAPSEFHNARKLDWIYVWSKTPVTLEPATPPLPYPHASDHLPVATRIRFT